MGEVNFKENFGKACEDLRTHPLLIEETQSSFVYLSRLKDGGKIVELSDLDPTQNSVALLISEQAKLLRNSPRKEAFGEFDQRNIEYAENFWNDLEELRKLIRSSTTNTLPSFFSKPLRRFQEVDYLQGKEAFQMTWSALQCMYGEKLEKEIFPRKKIVAPAPMIWTGDSYTTPFIVDAIQPSFYPDDQIGLIYMDSLIGNPQKEFPYDQRKLIDGGGFFRAIVEVALNTFTPLKKPVFFNLHTPALITGIPGQTLGSFLENNNLNPLNNSFYDRTLTEKIFASPIQRSYPEYLLRRENNPSHFDFLNFEISRKYVGVGGFFFFGVREMNSFFRIGLLGNDLINDLFYFQELNLETIHQQLNKLVKKTEDFSSDLPGIVRIFTLPPHPNFLLQPIPDKEGYYSYHPWLADYQQRGKSIHPNFIVSPEKYREIDQKYQDVKKLVHQVLGGKGWIVLDNDTAFFKQLDQTGYTLENIEGFGTIKRKGFETMIGSDDLHPTPATSLLIYLREIEELYQRGIQLYKKDKEDSAEPIYARVMARFESRVRKDPSKWFHGRMSMEEIQKFRKNLELLRKNGNSKIPFTPLFDETTQNWSYFTREFFIKYLKLFDSSLKELNRKSLERELVRRYQQITPTSSEPLTAVDDNKLKEHQLARLIRMKVKLLDVSKKESLADDLFKLIEEEVNLKEESYWSQIKLAQLYYEGASTPPEKSPVQFGFPIEAKTILSTSYPVGFALRVGPELLLPRLEFSQLRIAPLILGVSTEANFLGRDRPADLRLIVGARSCLIQNSNRAIGCVGAEIHHSFLSPWGDFSQYPMKGFFDLSYSPLMNRKKLKGFLRTSVDFFPNLAGEVNLGVRY